MLSRKEISQWLREAEALDLAIDIINMHGIPVGFRGSGIYTAMQKYEEQVGDK